MNEQPSPEFAGDLSQPEAARLREIETQYRVLLDLTPSYVLALEPDMTIRFCNAAYARMFERPADELAGQSLLELFPPFAKTASYAAYRRILETGVPEQVIGPIGPVYLHAHIFPAPWGLLSVAQDITEQKQAEKRSKLAHVMTDLLDEIDIALWELDTEYHIVSMNRRAKEIYGADVLGQPCYQVAAKTNRVCPNCPAKKVYEGAPSGRSEHRRVDTRGNVIYIDHIATPIKDEQDRLTGALVLIIDITEHKRAEEELREAYEEQTRLREEVIAAQQRIIGELSTPVIPVMEGILVAPMVGSIDTERARRITETLLQEIGRTQARIVILDITGVPVVDTSIANALLQTAAASRLLGSEVVLVGIPPAVAQTIVQLGVNLQGLATRADLQSGVEYALQRLGHAIVDIG